MFDGLAIKGNCSFSTSELGAGWFAAVVGFDF